MTSNDSKAITVIRYPLIIMVTMVHLYFGEWNRAFYDLPVFGFLTGRLLPTITQGAVPAFFFISGYLFFSQPGFNREVYLGKMRRRLGRLLKPYIVWNLIVLALIVLLQTLRPNALFVVHKPIADFTPGDFLACFWSLKLIEPANSVGPINGPLWFLQNLMVYQLAAPLVYIVLKKPVIGAAFLGVLTLLSGLLVLPSVAGFSDYTFLFFSIGAFLAIHGISITGISGGKQAFAVLAIFVAAEIAHASSANVNARAFATLVSYGCLIIVFFYLAGIFSRFAGKPLVKTMSSSSMFVFCYQFIPQGFFYYLVTSGRFAPKSDLLAVMLFFGGVAIVCALGTAIYWLLERMRRTN